MRFSKPYTFILIGLVPAACATTGTHDAPGPEVIDARPSNDVEPPQVSSEEPLVESPNTHIVVPGDTLWSIAWRYRIDVNELVSLNQLENPDLILAGQPLIVTAQEVGTSRSAPGAPNIIWTWPVRGPLVSAYGDAEGAGKGIGIGGTIGADIAATAAGQVVYAGDGLASYGNLIIIKHNETYLSAYGQNDELLVGEGDTVHQGQVIAKMGLGPHRQPQVHFEIRRNGLPIDPLELLVE